MVQDFPFYKLKNWSKFFFVLLVFYFQKSHSPCRKKRIFENQAKNNQNNTHFYKLKTGPIMLRNILGPIFNFYLDQFLTYKFVDFLFFFFFGGAETPILIVFSAKNAKFKETQKNKKDTICEHNCANCSCQSALFFCIFHFCCFLNFRFLKMFLFGFPKSTHTKKNQSKQNKKQEQTEDKRCKAKTNEILWFKTKQDN